MTRLRFLGVLTAGIVALLGVALVVVWLTVNPNNYKGRIAAAVKESTGRELKLSGDIKLSVFPWVALELGPASLGNPPGFGDEPFLSLRKASVRVKLLPLLRKRLEVGRIEVDGLDLRLKSANGRGNWQGTESNPAAKADVDHTANTPEWRLLANIRVRQGRASYQGDSIENLNFETGSLTNQRIPVSVSFDARTASGEQLSLKAKFDLSEDAAKQLSINALNSNGTRGTAGVRLVDWDLSAPGITLNLSQQTLSIPAFSLGYAGARLTGSAQATNVLDDLSVTGALSVAPVVPRELAPRLGITLPQTRDPKAMAQLSASADFSYGAKAVDLNHLQVRLDDTQLQGSIKLLTAENNAVRFDLAVDQIDLDRYRAPEVPAAAPPTPAAQKPSKGDKPLEASGTLTVKAVQVARLSLTSLRVTLTAKEQVMHLFPIEAQLDGGRYSGDITLDSRSSVPTLSLDEHLSGVDMARLLANTAQKGRLSGRANVNLKATARGGTVDAMLKTLSGHLDANLADGALEGIDVGYEINLAQALINRSPAAAGQSTGHTPFQAFKVSAQIANGIAETHDLTITSQAIKVAGQGNANLSSKVIDFKLLTSVSAAPARNTDIPLRVTGTYIDPTVRPDIEAVAKDQVKQKLLDVLKKNGLQGLFNK